MVTFLRGLIGEGYYPSLEIDGPASPASPPEVEFIWTESMEALVATPSEAEREAALFGWWDMQPKIMSGELGAVRNGFHRQLSDGTVLLDMGLGEWRVELPGEPSTEPITYRAENLYSCHPPSFREFVHLWDALSDEGYEVRAYKESGRLVLQVYSARSGEWLDLVRGDEDESGRRRYTFGSQDPQPSGVVACYLQKAFFTTYFLCWVPSGEEVLTEPPRLLECGYATLLGPLPDINRYLRTLSSRANGCHSDRAALDVMEEIYRVVSYGIEQGTLLVLNSRVIAAYMTEHGSVYLRAENGASQRIKGLHKRRKKSPYLDMGIKKVYSPGQSVSVASSKIKLFRLAVKKFDEIDGCHCKIERRGDYLHLVRIHSTEGRLPIWYRKKKGNKKGYKFAAIETGHEGYEELKFRCSDEPIEGELMFEWQRKWKQSPVIHCGTKVVPWRGARANGGTSDQSLPSTSS